MEIAGSGFIRLVVCFLILFCFLGVVFFIYYWAWSYCSCIVTVGEKNKAYFEFSSLLTNGTISVGIFTTKYCCKSVTYVCETSIPSKIGQKKTLLLWCINWEMQYTFFFSRKSCLTKVCRVILKQHSLKCSKVKGTLFFSSIFEPICYVKLNLAGERWFQTPKISVSNGIIWWPNLYPHQEWGTAPDLFCEAVACGCVAVAHLPAPNQSVYVATCVASLDGPVLRWREEQGWTRSGCRGGWEDMG